MTTAQKVALATCVSTLALIAVGALVRATGSGLGCPDWPLCHGSVVPPGGQGHQPIVEFSHRFVAAAVGLLVIATAVFAWREYRHVSPVLWSATITVPLVGLQGLLGAITVWRELPPEIVATHLLTAMVILSLEGFTFIGMSRTRNGRESRDLERPVMPGIGRWAVLSIAWFAVLLWVGGYMAESGASTACSGWPLCNGSVVPAADDHEIVHMLHRYLAAGFLAVLVPLVLATWQQRRTIRWGAPVAIAVAALYVAQVVVGALNVWYTFPDAITVAHTSLASLLWFALSSAAILALYHPATQEVAASPGIAGARA
jgi:heme A synthase